MRSRVALLDRDGVLNTLVKPEDFGLINSPLLPHQVKLTQNVAQGLMLLVQHGFQCVICSNQPGFEKGPTSPEQILDTHFRVLDLIQKSVHDFCLQEKIEPPKGPCIKASYLCLHQQSSHCHCRKPGIGLLQTVIKDFGSFDLERSVFIGDSLTDLQAAKKAGIHSVLIGSKRWDAVNAYLEEDLHPLYHSQTFLEATQFVTQRAQQMTFEDLLG